MPNPAVLLRVRRRAAALALYARSGGEFLGVLFHFPPDPDHGVTEMVEVFLASVSVGSISKHSGTNRGKYVVGA